MWEAGRNYRAHESEKKKDVGEKKRQNIIAVCFQKETLGRNL